MSKANIAHIYCMRPTKKQREFISQTFGCSRFVWNKMLSDRTSHYKETGETIYPRPAQYKEEFPFLKEPDSLALTNEQLQLEKAFRDFFSGKCGYPNYKSKKDNIQSYTTNNQKGTIRIVGNRIKLPKIGWVKIIIDEILPDNYKIKHATVEHTPDDKYYCVVTYEYEEIAVPEDISGNLKSIGLDFKLNGLYIDSEGNCADMSPYYKNTEKRISREQKKLSRKEKDSHNYKKEQIKLAKKYRHSANQRNDFLQKTSTEIANRYDVVCVENINLKNMSNKKTHLGKSVYDTGYGKFCNMIEYKQKMRGHYFIKIDKFYPSTQICSNCGYQNKDISGIKKISIRKWICPECGMSHDRDINAAINIKYEGIRILKESV